MEIESIECTRRTVCYSEQAMRFLGRLRPERAEAIAYHLEEKFWLAQQSSTNRMPGWRPVSRCNHGSAQFIIDGDRFGALVQATNRLEEPFYVLYLGKNTHDVRKAMGN
jgi:hypothetical protein